MRAKQLNKKTEELKNLFQENQEKAIEAAKSLVEELRIEFRGGVGGTPQQKFSRYIGFLNEKAFSLASEERQSFMDAMEAF